MERRTVLMAAVLVAVTLSGCAGEPEVLTIEVLETPDDPVTGAFKLRASGPGDSFVWNLGPGVPAKEGREVEHVFGYTDGEVTVRVTATSGEDLTQETVKLTLGTGKNTALTPMMAASSDWITPDTELVLSAAGSTDPDGDPLYFRWSCRDAGPPQPPHAGGHGGSAGLPFGVHTLGEVSSDLPAADLTVDGDLCAGLNEQIDFSTAGTIAGTFASGNVYVIDVEIRDPKGQPYVGRHTVYVTPTIPDRETTLTFNGTMAVGSHGTLDQVWRTASGGQEPPETLDKDHAVLRFELPPLEGTISLGTSSAGPADVSYEIRQSGQVVIAETSDDTTIEAGKFQGVGAKYDLWLYLNAGGNTEWTVTFDVVYDMNPLNRYDVPAPV